MMRSIEDLADIIGRKKPAVSKALLRLDSNRSNTHETGKILSRLYKRKTGMDIDDLGSFQAPDYDAIGSGEIAFARDREAGNKEVTLMPSLSNIAAMAMAGKGKTNLLRLLAYIYITLGIAQVKIIDFLGNFKGLASCCRDTIVLDTPSINIMRNKHVPKQKWFNTLFDQISHHTATMIGGRSFLNRVNAEMIQKFEGTGEEPCLPDLYSYMEWLLRKRKLNQSDRGYCERIVGKLVSWDSESGGAFSCQRGTLDMVNNYNQIVALMGLSEELQRFYVSALIARDFYKRLYNPELSRKPLAYLLDEARHVFPKKDEMASVNSPILSILTQTRNVNMYWIVATQEPSKLAHTCLANSQTKIIMGIAEGWDLGVIQQSLRLNPDQVKEISQFGESGLAVIKFSEKYTEPFLTKINLFEETGNQEIAEGNIHLMEKAQGYVIPRSGLLQQMLFAREKERESKYGRISNSAQRLLKACGREPYKALTELYEASRLGSKGSKAKKELAVAGFINERDIPVRTRKGAGKKLISITEKGRSWLRDAGIKPLVKGKGGPRELYYSVNIQAWAEQKGFTVYREYRGSDLMLVSKDKEKISVEIACRKDNQINNIRRNLETKIYQKIVVAAETDKVKKQIEKEYKESEIDPGSCKINILEVNELLP